MSLTTYDLFFTGRDDPRRCVIIGEDVKPVYFCFETPERGLMPCTRTTVTIFNDRTCIICLASGLFHLQLYRNDKDACARLEWGPGNHLGSATIGSRQIPMSHLVLPGTSNK